MQHWFVRFGSLSLWAGEYIEWWCYTWNRFSQLDAFRIKPRSLCLGASAVRTVERFGWCGWINQWIKCFWTCELFSERGHSWRFLVLAWTPKRSPTIALFDLKVVVRLYNLIIVADGYVRVVLPHKLGSKRISNGTCHLTEGVSRAVNAGKKLEFNYLTCSSHISAFPPKTKN